jgi:hypothetical protein
MFNISKFLKEGLKKLNELNYIYQKLYDNSSIGYIEHFLEGRWIIKKDGNEQKFLEIWDSLVDFCESFDKKMNYTTSIGAGEGAIMSISAYNSGINIYSVSPLVDFINEHFISNYDEKMKKIKPWNIAG